MRNSVRAISYTAYRYGCFLAYDAIMTDLFWFRGVHALSAFAMAYSDNELYPGLFFEIPKTPFDGISKDLSANQAKLLNVLKCIMSPLLTFYIAPLIYDYTKYLLATYLCVTSSYVIFGLIMIVPSIFTMVSYQAPYDFSQESQEALETRAMEGVNQEYYSKEDLVKIKNDFSELKTVLDVNKNCNLVLHHDPSAFALAVEPNAVLVSSGHIKTMLEANQNNKEEAYRQIKAVLAHELHHIKHHTNFPSYGETRIAGPIHEFEADEAPTRLGLRKGQTRALKTLVDGRLGSGTPRLIPKRALDLAYTALQEIYYNLHSFQLSHPSNLMRDINMRMVERFTNPINAPAVAA